MQRALHGKAVFGIVGSMFPALASNARAFRSRASACDAQHPVPALIRLKLYPCDGGNPGRDDSLRLRRVPWEGTVSLPSQGCSSDRTAQSLERRAKYLVSPSLRAQRPNQGCGEAGLLPPEQGRDRNDDTRSGRDALEREDFGLTRSPYFHRLPYFMHGLRIRSGAPRWGALIQCYRRLANAKSRHPVLRPRGKFGGLLRIGATVAALCCFPLPASAQTLSGGISVQMQVGGRATANSPRNNGGAQTLGATTTDCTASSVPINFGRVTLNAAGTLPVNPGGTLRPIDADGSVSVICIPAGNPNGPGTSSVGIQISGTHGSPPLLLMTLNDTNISQGITYNLYKSPLRTSGTAFLFNDSATATVEGNSQADRTTVDLYGRVGIPTYPGGKPPAGMYRDTLTVTLFF